MKKQTQYNNPHHKDFEVNKDIEIDRVKTTNVNILLNRVRLDKKRTFRKRIVFSILLVTLVSSLAVYFII